MPLKARKTENNGLDNVAGHREVSECQQRMCDLLMVDFEGCCPVENDASGISRLLQSLLPRSTIDWSSVSAELVKQTNLGCVLKQCADEDDEEQDEEEVYGVNSLLRVHPNSNLIPAQKLCTVLLERCRCSQASTEVQLQFEKVMTSSASIVGLLVNERLSNLPNQVALPLFSTLRQEMLQAAKADKQFAFTHVVVVCRLHLSLVEHREHEHSVHPENAVLQRHSLCSFQFSMESEFSRAVSGDWDDDDVDLTPIRRVLLLTAAQFGKAIDEMKRELEE